MGKGGGDPSSLKKVSRTLRFITVWNLFSIWQGLQTVSYFGSEACQSSVLCDSLLTDFKFGAYCQMALNGLSLPAQLDFQSDKS